MLDFSYDESTDILTIEGVKWSGDLLRKMCTELPLGKWFRMVERADGVITIGTVSPEIQQAFTDMVNK